MKQYRTPSEVKAWMRMSDTGTRALLNVGCEVGEQAMFDALSIVLHDQHGWGKDRLTTLRNELLGFLEENADIWLGASSNKRRKEDESGYLRQKLDDKLDEVYQRERGSLPFEKRYPMLNNRL